MVLGPFTSLLKWWVYRSNSIHYTEFPYNLTYSFLVFFWFLTIQDWHYYINFFDIFPTQIPLPFANLKVAVGGKDNILEGISDRIHMLHDAIASDAAQPKTEDIEHAFENFHSSRVIRKVIIDCPAFAVTLWKKALKGKCKIWAHGHRYFVFTS